MARIRSVKPALRTSQVVASWPREVRYFFVLFWGYLDDEGRGLDVPKTIAGDCFPHDDDVTPAKVNRWLDLMAKTKLVPDKEPPICRYEVAGRRLIHCVNWGEHQRPNRPTPSVIPHCPVHEPLSEPDSEPPLSNHGEPGEDALSPHVLEVDSRKLTAGEVDSRGTRPEPLHEPTTSEPPPRCPKHLDNPDPPPCGPCADARRRRQQWDADRAAGARAAPRCTKHRGQPAHNCALCRSEDLARPPEDP